MRNRTKILGVGIDNLDFQEATSCLEAFLDNEDYNMVFTPNSEILVDAVKDSDFTQILNNGDLVVPDGIGVVIASRFYKTPLKEKVAGYDLMCKLIETAYNKGKSMYFLGGEKGVAEEAALNLTEKYDGVKILGWHNGYFDEEEEKDIIEKIRGLNPDIVFVALGAPKQEKWIYKNRDLLKTSIAMGVGGSIDVLAGKVKRAPEFFCKYGLEWFYRLLKEPKRFFRILKLPKFILLSLYDAKIINKNEEE